jgi:uncharacterized repeat protein (TIGR02543 family)
MLKLASAHFVLQTRGVVLVFHRVGELADALEYRADASNEFFAEVYKTLSEAAVVLLGGELGGGGVIVDGVCISPISHTFLLKTFDILTFLWYYLKKQVRCIMGYWLNNPPTPQDMNSFEQCGWDKLGLYPDQLWGKVFGVVGCTVFGIAIVTAATVVLVKWIKQRPKGEPKKKGLKRVCLVKLQMTDTTAEESEVVMVSKEGEIPKPERDGYRFIGWFYDREYKQPFMPVDEIKENMILYARWVKEGD